MINIKTGEIVKDNKGVADGGSSSTTGKYVPPHLRQQQQQSSTSKSTTATSASTTINNKPLTQDEITLKRKLNGLINKLSTSNFYSIYNEITQLFNSNPRNTLKQMITELILTNSCDQYQLMHHIIHVNTALISVLNSDLGTDIGGYFIEYLFKKYITEYNQVISISSTTTNTDNSGDIIGSLLICDFAKSFIESFTDSDIQLLLLLIQNAGYQLRGEDPAALKDIITLVQKKHQSIKSSTSSTEETEESTSSTTTENNSKVTKFSFMMETLNNLKNNKIKNSKLIDTIQAIKKVIRGLLRSKDLSISSSTLRISLKDLNSIETTGRWWLVGSSWAGNQGGGLIDGSAPSRRNVSSEEDQQVKKKQSSGFSSELMKLATENKMSTDLQKTIFCILLSSEDYLDAFENIMELKLKDKQDREVIHVLMHCCLKEKKFNPFYFHLAYRLCNHQESFKYTLQYTIWDYLKDLTQLSKGPGGLCRISNLSNLLARLIENHTFSLTILRVVDFNQLDPISIAFYRLLFTYLLTKPTESQVENIFERIVTSLSSKKQQNNSSHLTLKKGILVFFIHGLLSTDDGDDDQDTNEMELLRKRIKFVKIILKAQENTLF
eukprot:gene8650-10647_t